MDIYLSLISAFSALSRPPDLIGGGKFRQLWRIDRVAQVPVGETRISN